jgi:hypothetical protein
MCSTSCCSSRCCNIVYYICWAIIFIYLILCVALIPKYRYVAIMVISIFALYATSAWRLLPSEQQVVRKRAEMLARQRCPPPPTEETVVHPYCSSPTLTGVVAFHEPFTGDARL